MGLISYLSTHPQETHSSMFSGAKHIIFIMCPVIVLRREMLWYYVLLDSKMGYTIDLL